MSSGLDATTAVQSSNVGEEKLLKDSDSGIAVDDVAAVMSKSISADHPGILQLEEHPAENLRPMKVIVIGAGFSGIYMGIRIPELLRNVELTIYDKNDGFGGTWWENRYPGIACDIPAHSYCYSFEPKKDWSTFYGTGPEIQAYMEGVARKYSVDRFTKFGYNVTACNWNSQRKKWSVETENVKTKENVKDEADVVVSARGFLNDFKWPDIEGLSSFRGKLLHSARWDTSFDYTNKRIGVIGVGSSAIQIVPSLQKLDRTKLSCFIRGKTWISMGLGDSAATKVGMSNDHLDFSEEMIEQFAEDSKAYHRFRKTIETEINGVHISTFKGSDFSEAGRQLFKETMKEKLQKKPEILDQILPDFAPGCRRLTPGPGFLEALTEDNVDFISTPIRRIVPEGIELVDGTRVELDVLVCATGFNTSGTPPFQVTGLDGVTLQKRFDPYPEAYLSLVTDGFPNWFSILGPNAGVGSGSLTKIVESLADYIVKCVRKMQKEGISAMLVKEERVKDFYEYADSYFRRTVYLDDCKSWYRRDDRITGLWPGSTLHAIETLRSPRWEDFEYIYDDEDGGRKAKNRMAWLGNGWSALQLEQKDLSYYIEPEFIDFPAAPLPEETSKWTILSYSH